MIALMDAPNDEPPTARELAAQTGLGLVCRKCGRILISVRTTPLADGVTIRTRRCPTCNEEWSCEERIVGKIKKREP